MDQEKWTSFWERPIPVETNLPFPFIESVRSEIKINIVWNENVCNFPLTSSIDKGPWSSDRTTKLWNLINCKMEINRRVKKGYVQCAVFYILRTVVFRNSCNSSQYIDGDNKYQFSRQGGPSAPLCLFRKLDKCTEKR